MCPSYTKAYQSLSWSAAGAFGPILITTIRNEGVSEAHGGSLIHIYNVTFYIMCALLIVGLILTLLIRPLVHPDDEETECTEHNPHNDEGSPLLVRSDPDKLRHV